AGGIPHGRKRDETLVNEPDLVVAGRPPRPGAMGRPSAQPQRIVVPGPVKPEDENRLALLHGLATGDPEIGVPADLSPGILVAVGTDQIANALEGLWPKLTRGNRPMSRRRRQGLRSSQRL